MRRWLAMTLRRFCALLGWTGIRRWSQAIARVEQAEAAAAAAAPDARPASGSGAEAGYDLGVTWNAATASVGVTRGGTRKLWAEGRVEGQRSQRVYLAPKRGGRCHLVFLPHRARAGVPVRVNGEELGTSRTSHAPAGEWGVGGDLVEQVRVELAGDSPWVHELALSLGRDLQRR